MKAGLVLDLPVTSLAKRVRFHFHSLLALHAHRVSSLWLCHSGLNQFTIWFRSIRSQIRRTGIFGSYLDLLQIKRGTYQYLSLFAEGRTRTGTWLPTQDFESSTSTNSITSAYYALYVNFSRKIIIFKNFLFLHRTLKLDSHRILKNYQI